MSRASKAIERLSRRRDWLEKRIADNPEKDLSYDKAELSATEYAIERLKQENPPSLAGSSDKPLL